MAGDGQREQGVGGRRFARCSNRAKIPGGYREAGRGQLP
jgi:transposase